MMSFIIIMHDRADCFKFRSDPKCKQGSYKFTAELVRIRRIRCDAI
jgi:hypothetical protein